MDSIYRIRKDLLYLKNGVSPLKDILETIVRADAGYFPVEVKKYFADVHDNTVKIFEAISTYKEMMNGLYEAQVANRNDDMNRKIMTLTVITVIFIPLSFLTGIFGMNFLHMPLLAYEYSFFIFIALCVAIVTLMLFYFKRKKWF
jgi:magnesium transporter